MIIIIHYYTHIYIYIYIYIKKIIKKGKFGGRGKIPETFSPGDEIDLTWKKNEFAKQCRL